MSLYSFSQVGTFTQCPLKYRYKYVDKIKLEEFVETADTILGNIVHSVLEKLYNDINIGKIPAKEDLLSYYHQLRQKKDDEAKAKGGEIIINSDLSLDDYKARGEKYINKYYDKHTPFEDIKVIDTELSIVFDMHDDIKFRGFVDRLDKVGDTFIISDYKTNKKLPTEDKDHYIEQLTLYGIGIKEKYGKYFKKLKAKLYFLHFDIEDEREITAEKLEEVSNKYLEIIEDIERKKLQFEKGNKKIFEANKTPLCRWCEYMNICPLFTYINEQEEVVSSLSQKTLAALIDEFVAIKEELKSLKDKEEGLKNIFLDYVEKKESDTGEYLLQGSTKDLRITESPSYKILDKEKFLQKIKEIGLFDEIAEVTRQKVNSLFKEEKEVHLNDFVDIIAEDTSYRINAVKKKDK